MVNFSKSTIKKMKQYLFKAISTNTKDMRTGLILTIDDQQYVFNTPDGFQRQCLFHNVSFGRSKYVFVSSLQPNYFAGFPGFYMSAREDMRGNIGLQSSNIFVMTVLGPQGLTNKLLNSFNFMGRMRNLRTIEFT